jgi:Xaa-Pro aminopeptidase
MLAQSTQITQWYDSYYSSFRKIQWQTKAVYNAVLRVKNEATKMLVPGTLWKQYHIEVGKLMTSELLGLGLLDKADVRKPRQACIQKIFHARNIAPYGTRHPWLRNLDWTYASQYGFHRRTGNLYSAEGFGIRLEDDLVIQESGEPFNLMRNIPIEADEIESLMN